MKINRKDFLFMYLLGILTFLLVGTISIVLDDYPIYVLATFIFLLIPGGFYFHRNPCTPLDALLISLIFGLTILPIFFLIVGVPLVIIQGLLIGFPDFSSIAEYVNPMALVAELFVSGLMFGIPSFISYFLVKYLISKPKH